MRSVLALAALVFICNSVEAQEKMTGKEIYGRAIGEVVQIGSGTKFRGTGFIISSDGLIVTANHVVTTEESKFREYVPNIIVVIFRGNSAMPYPASPVSAKISDDQVNFDTALLKVNLTGLPFATLGDWKEVAIGDPITIIPWLPDLGLALISGTVSNTGTAPTKLGPKRVNTIALQAPLRAGFSGSPVFAPNGRVVGIVTTKLYGISEGLDSIRKQLNESSRNTTVIIQGANFAITVTALIDTLDEDLVSGMGTAVDTGYAKAMQQEANKKPETQH